MVDDNLTADAARDETAAGRDGRRAAENAEFNMLSESSIKRLRKAMLWRGSCAEPG
jgi:hypothetical protein